MLALLTAAMAAVLAAAGTASAQWRTTVVASGLDNPRGIAVGPNGAVYVAEAGHGGAGPCGPGAGVAQACYGASGAVTQIAPGPQQRIVSALPSLAGPGPQDVAGPHDVAVRGTQLFVTIGLGAPVSARATFGPGGASLGQVIELLPGGSWRNVADLASFEASANPDGGVTESNPYSLVDMNAGQLVADAGGNDLIRVEADGRIVASTIFPQRSVPAPPGIGPPGGQLPLDSVPDSVAVGPDGALYIGELTGFPFPFGGARIYRRVPGPPAPQTGTVWATGFTNIIDLAFAPDGSLYVLEYATNGILSRDPTGRLLRIAPDGTRTTVLREALVNPTGLAVGPTGTIYVSNFGLSRGGGEVLAITEQSGRGRGR
jgi:hypothetical protein